MRKPTWYKALALSVAAALTLSGCFIQREDTAPTPVQTTDGSGTTEPDISTAVEGFESYYSQTVDWNSCGEFQCAQVEAPMDWADPTSEKISLAIKFSPAENNNALGTVILNPGGPGGSGVELVSYAPYYFGAELLENYNLLGFDPRGVGQSSAVKCYEPEEMDRYLALSYDPENPRALALAEKASQDFGNACLENTGDLLGHVDTQSAARDMDLLRALVGDTKLNYLGFSYGTQLGATYAGIFPEKVGKMVLDGAIDLRLTAFDQSKQQAVGFENALTAFVENCVSTQTCAVPGTVEEVKTAIGDLLTQIGKKPLPTEDPDRPLTQSLAFYGIAQPLYSESLWADLGLALDSAMGHRDGTLLLELSDSYFGRDEDGTYMDNQTEAFSAVNCLDDRSSFDPAVMQAEYDQLTEAAPVMGQFFGFGGIGCKHWPFDQTEKDFDLSAKGAAPILIIGTTNDPATPYIWAEGLAEQLDSGVLITHVGEGHTAYGMGSQCVIDTVDQYFVAGTVPAKDPNCEG